MPMTSPIPMLTSIGPAESSRTNTNASRNTRTIASGVISISSRVTENQAANDQEPAIDQHEQQQLKGQRYHGRGKHLHSHRQEYVGDDHIDDDEWHKQQKADFEAFF